RISTPPTSTPFPYTTLFRSYQAKAGTRLSNVATVSLTVQEVNDPPTAVADSFTGVKQRTGTTIGVDQPIDVLANDSILPDVSIKDRKSTRLNSSHVSISYAV